MSRETVQFADLGAIRYQPAWDLQEKLLSENVGLKLHSPRGTPPEAVQTRHHLLFCEHPHVFTLGKSGDANNLLVSEAQRADIQAEFYPINRGGDITYHGPGQLVVYPILDLEKFRTDLGWYLRSLEEVIIQVLTSYGLQGHRLKGATGVWLDPETPAARKICAMGVRCSRWITMHGLAFNILTDLSYFNYIVPCGIADKGVTSLAKELGYNPDFEEVKNRVKSAFEEVFSFSLIPSSLI